MTRSYRPDIDGLRAIAVTAVLLYHYGVPAVPGGYVGVDVFFVVSGYLMMSLIHGDILAGRFSIAAFYERRIRRIFPALFAMLLGTMACGFVILFPNEFASLGKTAMAAALFVANAGYWWRADYFGQTADRLPLLHTWSLSLEEQFYLVFPLLMIFTARKLAGRYAACCGVSRPRRSLSVWGPWCSRRGPRSSCCRHGCGSCWRARSRRCISGVPHRVAGRTRRWRSPGSR
jgi:peptidoglycan/LPS O-acetylase OafA/YrhL